LNRITNKDTAARGKGREMGRKGEGEGGRLGEREIGRGMILDMSEILPWFI